MNRQQKHLIDTAYHEAGHAVVAYWKNIPFKYVTIIPDEDTLGHLEHWPKPKWFQPDIECSPRVREKLDNHIIGSLAGRIAGKKITGRYNNVGSSHDIHNAVNLASYLGDDEKGLYLKWMQSCAEALVDIRWQNIKAVAQALLKKKKLTKKEVQEIIIEPILKNSRKI